jgi:hypothetical protein
LTLVPDDRISLTTNDTLENVEIHGYITAGGTNITIRCVKVVSTNFFPIDTERPDANIVSANDILIDHVEVDCKSWPSVNGAFLIFGATVQNSKMKDCTDGYRLGHKGVINDSFCGNQGSLAGAEAHYDCAQTGGNGADFVFRHNTFSSTDTSGFGIGAQESGDTHDILIEKNLLIGDPSTHVIVGSNPTDFDVYNIDVRDNYLGPDYRSGYCQLYGNGVATMTWTNNIAISTGLEIPKSSCTS